jgi:hypothetical protein
MFPSELATLIDFWLLVRPYSFVRSISIISLSPSIRVSMLVAIVYTSRLVSVRSALKGCCHNRSYIPSPRRLIAMPFHQLVSLGGSGTGVRTVLPQRRRTSSCPKEESRRAWPRTLTWARMTLSSARLVLAAILPLHRKRCCSPNRSVRISPLRGSKGGNSPPPGLPISSKRPHWKVPREFLPQWGTE